MASSPSPADCESQHSEMRLTRDGRRIIYDLKVKQNPEKARACGQGAKSSTDRRPVDPPPIIALTIHEEEEGGHRKDITYNYRANFFMFASLENARPMAQGRGMSRDPSMTPILCGAPVSGISYLDRPEQAGYFIFPDLSVRQEGRYRLCFTLYEELRDSSMEDRYDENASPELHMEHVCARCIVRTNPFTVYSAKKFPGLSESTTLSRTVAEQGCRVRIRRDVRMRKRETKNSKHYASDDEDADLDKPQQPASPDVKHTDSVAQASEDTSRPASTSGTPFQAPGHKVPTSAPQAQYQPPQYTSMAAPSPHPSYPGAPQHESASTHSQHFDQPPMPSQFGQQTYSHHQHIPQSPHHQISGFPPPPQMPYAYQNQQYFPYQQHYGYMPHQQMQSPAYPPLRQDSMSYVSSPQDYQAAPGSQYHTRAPQQSSHFSHHSNSQSRSASLSGPPTANMPSNSTHHAQPSTATSPAPSHLSSQQDSQTGRGHSKHNLPPIQTHHPHQASSSHPHSHPLPTHRPSYDSPHPQSHHRQHPHSALNSSAPSFYPTQHSQQQPPHQQHHYHQQDLPSHLVPPPPQYIAPATAGPTSSKRSYASTFDTQHMDGRLQSGARPNTNGVSQSPYAAQQHNSAPSTAWAYPDSAIGGSGNRGQSQALQADADGSDEEDMEPMMMAYRRADGTVREMKWPLGH